MSSREALRLAEEQDLDLVKIAAGSGVPVCKIMDYGKYKFEMLKKQKEAILQSSTDASCVCTRMKQAEQVIDATASTLTEWNETAVRQIVERVTVLSTDEVLVRIKGGSEIKQRLER